MSSDEDYYPDRRTSSREDSACSKRLTRSQNLRAKEAKIVHVNEKKSAKRRSTMREILPKVGKRKTDEKSKNERKTVCSFSEEPLTDDELRQLFMKFRKDGHFHVNPSSENDKVVNTNNRENDTTATVTSQGKSNDAKKNVPSDRFSSKMIFSNPLPNASGSTLHISTSNERYFSPANRLNVQTGISGITGNHYESSSCMDFRKKFLSSGQYRMGIEIPSNESSFSFVTPAKQRPVAPIASRLKRIFPNENSPVDGWKSQRNVPSSREFYHPVTSGQLNYTLNVMQNPRFNSKNTGNDVSPCGNSNNTKLSFPITRRKNETFVNSNMIGNTTFPNNQKNSEKWMTTGQLFPTLCTNENPSNVTSANVLNPLPENSTNYVSSSKALVYNSQTTNFIENRQHGPIGNENSTIVDCMNANPYNSSFMSWNSLQGFPSLYETGSDESYGNNVYNMPNSSSISGSTMFRNDSSDLANQINSYDNLLNNGLMINDNKGTTNSSKVVNNHSNTTTTTNVVSTATTNSKNTEISRINKTMGKSCFERLNDFPDSQNDEFCPRVSSICSYDDDLGYENYIDENFTYGNDNNVMTENIGALTASMLTRVKTEVRPLYDVSNNYPSYNDDTRRDSSIFYDFDTKTELTNSPDCVIMEKSSRAGDTA